MHDYLTEIAREPSVAVRPGGGCSNCASGFFLSDVAASPVSRGIFSTCPSLIVSNCDSTFLLVTHCRNISTPTLITITNPRFGGACMQHGDSLCGVVRGVRGTL